MLKKLLRMMCSATIGLSAAAMESGSETSEEDTPFVSVTPVIIGEPASATSLRDHSYYSQELRKLEESTRQIHEKVERILAEFRRNMKEYWQHTRGTGATVEIVSDTETAPNTGIVGYTDSAIREITEQAGGGALTIPPPPAAPIDQFKQIQRAFEAYQTDPAQDKKHKIVVGLNSLILSGGLKDDEKRQAAVDIAEVLDAQTLKTRLGVCCQEDEETLYALPAEIMRLIIKEALKGGNAGDVNAILRTSKRFNLMMFLSKPISFDLRKFDKLVTNQALVQIVQLFPMTEELNLEGCKRIGNEGLIYLEGLKNLTVLSCCIENTGSEHLKSLGKLTNLTRLTVKENTEKSNIVWHDLPYLKDLKKLTYLDFPWHISCWTLGTKEMQPLRKALPGLEIKGIL